MTEQTNCLVEASGICCSYQVGTHEVVALASASCRIHQGDQIALVGPSGSGKSTLLQVLGGLEAVTKGEISWPAIANVESLRPYWVSFIFQMPSLLAPLSVIENVELPLLMMKRDEQEARKEALEALERLEINRLADKLPEELSGGKAQRVAVARALASKPKLILADEPTGQLDHPTALHMMDVLFAYLKESHTAIVVATHDDEIASRFKTRWQMNQGRLERGIL